MKNLKKEVLDNFDFEKVHRVMVFLNWTWSTKKKKDKIPSIKKMKKHADRLIEDTIKGIKKYGDDSYSISEGGFEACAFYGVESM